MNKPVAPLSWLPVVAGAYLFGVALSGMASAFGLTNFPGDRRGEWSMVVLPIVLLCSWALIATGYRRLARTSVETWKLRAVAASATAVGCVLTTYLHA